MGRLVGSPGRPGGRPGPPGGKPGPPAGKPGPPGGRPGPPGRPSRALVGPSARAAPGVAEFSGEDQDPSGSRCGEGTLLVRQASVAGAVAAGSAGGAGLEAALVPAGVALEPAGVALEPAGVALEPAGVAQEPAGAALEPVEAETVLVRLVLLDGVSCGRRNHPAGAVMPGHASSSAAGPSSGGRWPAGAARVRSWLVGSRWPGFPSWVCWTGFSSRLPSAGAFRCGARRLGTIRPDGTDQGGTTPAGSPQPNAPVRSASWAGEEPW